MSNTTNSTEIPVTSKRVTVARLFWFALLLPVNLLLQPIWFAIETVQPSLESTPAIVTIVKLGYFMSVCYGFYVLAKIWAALQSTQPRLAAGYRLAGLATLGGLISVHGSAIYHYAAPERELHREVRAISKSAPVWVAQGVRLERAHLEKINAAQYAPDEFIILGKTIYLLCPDGYGRSCTGSSGCRSL